MWNGDINVWNDVNECDGMLWIWWCVVCDDMMMIMIMNDEWYDGGWCD